MLSLTAFLLSSFQPVPKAGKRTMTVVIDAGHGGHDSGCLGKKSKEKDIALGIALKLGEYIEDEYQDVKVLYTRKKDEFVELHERADIANNARADLFICIHCNSACVYDAKKKKEYCNSESHGVESWVMGLHKTEANLEVAKRENEVVLLEKDYTQKYDGFDPNSPEANIIFSLYQNTFLDQSLRMASLVQQEVKAKGRQNRGVKQAGFLVLYKTAMPSILIETGFLSNPEEEKYLLSAKGQTDMAHSIFKAFKSYHSAIAGRPETTTGRQNEKDDSPAAVTTQEKAKETVEAKNELPVDSEKAKKDPEEKISSDERKPDPAALYEKPAAKKNDVYYTVQFYSSPVRLQNDNPKFKSIPDVFEYKENNVFKYMSGKVFTLDNAIALQNKVRSFGFKDAFVVGFKNGQKVGIAQVKNVLGK